MDDGSQQTFPVQDQMSNVWALGATWLSQYPAAIRLETYKGAWLCSNRAVFLFLFGETKI